jgi:hypothetical protein
MKRQYMLLLLMLIFGFSLLSAAEVRASDGQKQAVGRDSGYGSTSEEWSAQASVSHLPSADFRALAGDVGISDYRLKLTRTFKLDDKLSLSLGSGYGLKHIDASPQVGLPQDLHGLFVEAGARYRINDKSFASIKLFPGFYSDFKNINENDLRMPVLALGGYSFDNGFSVVGGCLYRFGYHAGRFIPALGFSYQPDQYWRFDMVAPRPAVTYFASRQLQLFAAGDFASDEYELSDRSFGAKAIKYSDYKAMLGVNYLPVPALKFSTSVGYAFDRKIAFYDATRSDMRVDDVPFFRVALEFGW